MKNILRNAVLALTLCALPALAGPDNVGLGRGDDTPPTINTANQVINTYARVTAPLAPGDTAIQIGTATGAADPIAPGDLLMVIQMTGIVPEPPSGDTNPINMDANQAVGRWEFARVRPGSDGVQGSTVNLTDPLLYSYAANVTQVVRVPEYASLTIPATRSLSPSLWDGNTGGVLAFLVTGTLTTNSGTPALNAAGRGFRSGQPLTDPSGDLGCTGLDEPGPKGGQKGEGIAATRYGASVTGRGHVTTGGGGGVCDNSGGGGGGHSGSGGQGGNSNDGSRPVGGTGGFGVTYVTSGQFNHLLMGGGGGAGHSSGGSAAGGRGGGIVFVRAGALSGIGTMSANGDPGGNASGQDGSSGGGGGGSIYLRVSGAATCGNITAIGGNGGSSNSGFDVGPGGAGGGGRIIFQKGSGTCGLPGFAVNNGNPGVQLNSSSPLGASYGAQTGTAGTTLPLPDGFAVLPAPVVSLPANSVTVPINNVRPTYSGTIAVTPALPAGTEIAVYVDGVLLGTTTANSGTGAWSLATPGTSPALAQGSHTVYAVAINTTQGVQSANSNTNTFTVDTTPPMVVVQTPAEGSSTNNPMPPYSGTVSDNNPGPYTVEIRVDGNLVTTLTNVPGPNWTYTPTTPLAEGAHTVTATATDVAGNTANSNTNTFTVDTTPPTVVVQTPPNSSTTNNPMPVYSGTVSDNNPGPYTVQIRVDGNLVTTLTNVPGPNWMYTPTTPLAEGAHTVTATATDVAGNTANSNTNTFTVDTTPPTVMVQTPAEGLPTRDNTPDYSGTVSDNNPGPYTVEIRVDGNLVTTLTMVPGPNWTYTPTTPLADGSHTVTATATDVAGNTATDSNTFTVDTTAPAVAVTAPVNGSFTNDPTPLYEGTVEAGSMVVISVDGTVLGNATVVNGSWTFLQPTDLPPGSHTVTATATDAAGNTATASSTFTVDTTAPGAPVVSTPANGAILADNTPTYSGTAEPGSTVTIRVDGTVVGTATADSTTGEWTFTPVTGLSNGSHMVNVTAADAAGNVSPVSNTNEFTVDATIPAAPVITGPANNTVTNDPKPAISGTAPANSTVTVIIDGTSVGTATADANGNWTFTPTSPLAEGPHDISAVASNTAGNTSPPSNTVRITVDTGVPDTTIVSGPSGETDSTSATFDFSSNEPGVTYYCKLDNAVDFTLCTDPVTFENLAPGQHTLQVRAKDPAGNVDPTPATATWTVTQPDLTGGDRDFLGDGIGCAASGGDPSALAMMGLGLLAVMMVRRRRQ